jgi:GH24 family phage-related lysozyme (muramidase)
MATRTRLSKSVIKLIKKQADDLFSKDVDGAANAVKNQLGDTQVSQQEFDALVETWFNIGGHMDTADSPKLNDAISRSDYADMAINLRYTRDGRGNVEPGLARRSSDRIKLFVEGQYNE